MLATSTLSSKHGRHQGRLNEAISIIAVHRDKLTNRTRTSMSRIVDRNMSNGSSGNLLMCGSGVSKHLL